MMLERKGIPGINLSRLLAAGKSWTDMLQSLSFAFYCAQAVFANYPAIC